MGAETQGLQGSTDSALQLPCPTPPHKQFALVQMHLPAVLLRRLLQGSDWAVTSCTTLHTYRHSQFCQCLADLIGDGEDLSVCRIWPASMSASSTSSRFLLPCRPPLLKGPAELPAPDTASTNKSESCHHISASCAAFAVHAGNCAEGAPHVVEHVTAGCSNCRRASGPNRYAQKLITTCLTGAGQAAAS